MNNKLTRGFLILAIVLLAVSLACSAGLSLADDSRNDARVNDGASGDEGSNPINVVAEDFSFSLDSSQAESGTITFSVENNGFMNHDFAIRGNGVQQKTPMIEPGENATLTVELEPGTYTYICTVPGHEQLGMHGTFTVVSN